MVAGCRWQPQSPPRWPLPPPPPSQHAAGAAADRPPTVEGYGRQARQRAGAWTCPCLPSGSRKKHAPKGRCVVRKRGRCWSVLGALTGKDRGVWCARSGGVGRKRSGSEPAQRRVAAQPLHLGVKSLSHTTASSRKGTRRERGGRTSREGRPGGVRRPTRGGGSGAARLVCSVSANTILAGPARDAPIRSELDARDLKAVSIYDCAFIHGMESLRCRLIAQLSRPISFL